MDMRKDRYRAEDSNGIPESGDILDFSSGILDWCNHGGSQRKKTLKTGNAVYMVKFPDRYRDADGCLAYRNNSLSEFVGCHIYESLGIPAQKTYLGKVDDHGRKVIVVACRDFANDGIQLYPMRYIHPADPFAPSFPGKLTRLSLDAGSPISGATLWHSRRQSITGP